MALGALDDHQVIQFFSLILGPVELFSQANAFIIKRNERIAKHRGKNTLFIEPIIYTM